MNISLYNGSKDTVGASVDYRKVLKAIAEGRWKESIQNLSVLLQDSDGDSYAKAKKLLPSVTFSGSFAKRAAEMLTFYSKMIILDVDGLTADQIKMYKEAFRKNPMIHACFISPSGAGLKILIKVDCKSEDHLKAFLQLEEYFKNNYAITLDKSGKDVSRLCYISYDPDMIYNEDALVFPVDVAMVVNTVSSFDKRPENFKGHVVATDAEYVYKVCKMWTERHHQYEQGNRNNYIHVLSCNMNRAGVHMKDAALMIYNEFSDLPIDEIEQTVKSAYKKSSEHNTVNVYEIEPADLPDPDREDLSQAEDIVYSDTLELLRKGVKKQVVAKLVKCFGSNHLNLADDTIATLMNQAFVKIKSNSGDGVSHDSATDALIKAISEYKDTGGIPTGIMEFDEILHGGLMPSCLYGLIGVGGSYKSVLAHCIGADLARNDGLVVYFNMEMSRLQLMDRVVNKELGIELMLGLKDKSITEDKVPGIIDELKVILKDNFQIVDGSGFSRQGIVDVVKSIELKTSKKVSLILVDGLTQLEDTKKDEIKSSIFNSGELKECAKALDAAVLVLVHTSGGITKHTRNTAKFVRGGDKVTNHMDAMICTSMIIDEDNSNMDEGDIMYRQGIFYARLIDKRGSGLVSSKIVKVHRPLRLEALSVDPMTMEVKITN